MSLRNVIAALASNLVQSSWYKWNDYLDKVKLKKEAFSSKIIQKNEFQGSLTEVKPITFQNAGWML